MDYFCLRIKQSNPIKFDQLLKQSFFLNKIKSVRSEGGTSFYCERVNPPGMLLNRCFSLNIRVIYFFLTQYNTVREFMKQVLTKLMLFHFYSNSFIPTIQHLFYFSYQTRLLVTVSENSANLFNL